MSTPVTVEATPTSVERITSLELRPSRSVHGERKKESSSRALSSCSKIANRRVASHCSPIASTLLAMIRAPTPISRYGSFSGGRSEEHTSELQSRGHLVCRLLLEKKKTR